MKNVVKIIQAHGGIEALKAGEIRVDPPAPCYMRFCVEYVGKGPRGQALISLAHYYEQAGDLMADPEVVVEVADGPGWEDAKTWGPVSITMHGTGYHRDACWTGEDGEVYCDPRQVRDIRSFLPLWDRNLGEQGFVEAFLNRRKGVRDDDRERGRGGERGGDEPVGDA
jgi:hypothetical protein